MPTTWCLRKSLKMVIKLPTLSNSPPPPAKLFCIVKSN